MQLKITCWFLHFPDDQSHNSIAWKQRQVADYRKKILKFKNQAILIPPAEVNPIVQVTGKQLVPSIYRQETFHDKW